MASSGKDNPFSLLFSPLSADQWPLLRQLVDKILKEKGESYTVYKSAVPKTTSQLTVYDKTGYPVITPIDTLETLLVWEPGQDELCVSTVPLSPRAGDVFDASNVLVCHDMMGGYVNDRFVQGCQCDEDFYFYNWSQISTFVYFSHHFITIPPPSWTNAAHRNGVLCLGTVITEWKDGAILCSKLFSNEVTVEVVVDKLIQLAVYYQFDGWLINIENPIHFSQLESLMIFLTLLTTGLHQAIPGSKVIWYDSVTSSGELKWQNTLNESNSQYFDVVDGIFVNYHWTLKQLKDTVLYAKERASDVFIGIDVFGRGCFGGGGFNTNLALDVVIKHGLSAAIFAPSWVYENNSKTNFFENNDKFWSLLAPYCPTYAHTSLNSCFSRGRGQSLAINGKVVYKGVWSNYSSQCEQLSFGDKLHQRDQECNIIIQDINIQQCEEPYNNGSCLCVSGFSEGGTTTNPAIIRLFKTDISDNEGPLLVGYVYKTSTGTISHYMRLRTNGIHKFIILDSREAQTSNISKEGLPISHSVIRNGHCYVNALPHECSSLIHVTFTGGTCSDDDKWSIKYFIIDQSLVTTIKGVSLSLYSRDKGTFKLLIGEIKLISALALCNEPLPKVTLLRVDYINPKPPLLNCTLAWDHSTNSVKDPVNHYNIYYTTGTAINNQLLGVAYVSRFSVVDLTVYEGLVEFIVQAVTVSGRCMSVYNSSSLKLYL